MDKLLFFDLAFENDQPEMAEEFYNFFYRNNLIPLFTNEHRAQSITVSYIDGRSLLGQGNVANKLLLEFADYLNMAMDNKAYEQAVFKILYDSRSWPSFMKNIRSAIQYMQTILPEYVHNTWNIVFYDKDKSGTKVSRGV